MINMQQPYTVSKSSTYVLNTANGNSKFQNTYTLPKSFRVQVTETGNT